MSFGPTPDCIKLSDVLNVGLSPGRVYEKATPTGAGSQKLVLLVLWAMEGQPMSVRAVSEIANLSHGQTDRCLKLLLRRGLIRRERNTNNTAWSFRINTKACREQRMDDLTLVLPKHSAGPRPAPTPETAAA
ncbi:MAG: hypothetical protein H6826_14490 [Planctomycetes bacterium]|nr:hypothetical protein [Planctomycetota bacterium]